MITGNGNSGKSSILSALKNKPEYKCTPDLQSTHGIIIDLLEIDNTKFNVWDFGGQEVYHGTHRMFMESEAIQVIVFDPITEDLARSGTSFKDRDSDNEIVNHPVPYWFETIYALSKESAFVFVQNKMDVENEEDLKIKEYVSEKQKSDYIHVSAKEGKNIKLLKFLIAEATEGIPEFGMMMPHSWLKVRKFFIDNLKDESKSQKIITQKEFAKLCVESDVNPVTKDLLFKYLHHNGFIYYHPNLKDKIIADQRWALDAIYKPLNRKAYNDEFRKKWEGKVRVERLFEIFGETYSTDEKWLFLEFMKSCGLCFQLNNKSNSESKNEGDVYVFPEFLPKNPSEIVSELWKYIPNVIIFRLKLQWANYFVIQSLISNLGRKTQIENIWRNGIHITTPEGSFKVELNYEQKSIFLSIEEKAMTLWLEPILEEIKVGDSKKLWEISIGNDNFEKFNFENWKKDKENFKKGREELANEIEKKQLIEKLPEPAQELGRPFVLFFAANTEESGKLNLKEEFEKIEELAERDFSKIEVKMISFATLLDFQTKIEKYRPNIIHFAGHGKDEKNELSELARAIGVIDWKNDGGLIFYDSDRKTPISIDGETLNFNLKSLIEDDKIKIDCVLFNACYSIRQAETVSKTVKHVIGVNNKIADGASIDFTTGFYRALINSRDFRTAFNKGFGLARVKLKNEHQINLFIEGKKIEN